MGLVAADAASPRVSNVDCDVESPIHQETHTPNDIPFTSDTANHCYKATAIGNILKKMKKGRKKRPRLFGKISWKKKTKGGNKVDAKRHNIQNMGRKEKEVDNGSKVEDTAEEDKSDVSQKLHDSKSIKDSNPSPQLERQALVKSSSRSSSPVSDAHHGSMASNSPKKILDKLFSDALAVSVTHQEADKYVQAQDPAFQCSEEAGSLTEMLKRSKYMNKDIEAEDKGDLGLTVLPVTSFEQSDTLSTTSSVTNNSAGSANGILIEKKFTMMSAVTTEGINHDPEINDQEAYLENDTSLKEHAENNPSNADNSVIEYDCDAIAATLHGDEASKRSPISENSTVSTKSTKNKRSLLVCMFMGNDGAAKAEEMDESVQPSDDRSKSNVKGSSQVGSQVSRQDNNQVSQSNIDGSMTLMSNDGATSKVTTESKIPSESKCSGGNRAEIQAFRGARRGPPGDYASKAQSNTNVNGVDNIAKASTGGFACGMGGFTRDIMTDVKTSVKKAVLNIALTGEVEVAYSISSFEQPLLEGISTSSSTLSGEIPTESCPQKNNADSRHDLSSALSWSDIEHGQKKSCFACHAPDAPPPIKQNDSIMSWKDM